MGELGGGFSGFGSPGDEQGHELRDGIRVIGKDADGVAEEAAFCGVHGGMEAVAGVAFVFKLAHRRNFRMDDFAAGIHTAREDPDRDVFGSQGIEENAGGDFNFVVEIHFTNIVGNALHREPWPGGFHASAPGGEIPGVGGERIDSKAKMCALAYDVAFAVS